MDFSVLRAALPNDRERWSEFWRQLPASRRDVFFQPEFALASEVKGGGEACCALLESGSSIWMYPFLRCSIPAAAELEDGGTYLDIQSPYGYGGPIVSEAGEDPGFLGAAWSHFDQWSSDGGVVAEFIRFHPLLDNQRWCHPLTDISVDRQTVPIDVRTYPEAVWNSSYFRIHRNMIRRAERAGFTFEVLAAVGQMEWFSRLYSQTQDWLGATKETRFGPRYFETLANGFRGRAWLGITRRSGDITSAVLILQGDAIAHCHLMGYQTSGDIGGMNNLLYHGVFLEANRRGMQTVHMGGGRTRDESDSLFRFKKSLSPLRATFSWGTRVHNPAIYRALLERWEKKHGKAPEHYFLVYRLQPTEPQPELRREKSGRVVGVGAGAHAKVVADILALSGKWTVLGLVDTNSELLGKNVGGLPLLGGDEVLPDLLRNDVTEAFIGIGGVGANTLRRHAYERVIGLGFECINAIHPNAVIASTVQLGKGVAIMAGVVVNSGAVIGDNVILNTGCIVEHDCVIGNHVHVAPGATLCGQVTVGASSHVGAGSTIRQGNKIGERVIVGDGAVVVSDVPDGLTVVGCPARELVMKVSTQSNLGQENRE